MDAASRASIHMFIQTYLEVNGAILGGNKDWMEVACSVADLGDQDEAQETHESTRI